MTDKRWLKHTSHHVLAVLAARTKKRRRIYAMINKDTRVGYIILHGTKYILIVPTSHHLSTQMTCLSSIAEQVSDEIRTAC